MTSKRQSYKDSQTVKELSSSSTTTTTVSTHPGVSQDERWVIADAYIRNIGEWTPKAQNRIQYCLDKGMEITTVLHAIDATGWAHRPSLQYLWSILHRYICAGIMTDEDVMRDEQAHFQRRESDLRRRHAKWYDDQSVLTEDDWRRDMPF